MNRGSAGLGRLEGYGLLKSRVFAKRFCSDAKTCFSSNFDVEFKVKKDDVMMSVIGTIFVSLELFAVAYVVFQVLTEGGWWLVGLIAYSFWLLYIGTFKGAIWNIGTGLILAVCYMMGGIIAAIFAYVGLLIFGEIFMKPKQDDGEN